MQHFEIDEVVPHGPPMSLLGAVEGYDDSSATTSLEIHPQQPFYNNELGGVPSYVGIEYMAQTIAAFSGIHCRLAGKPIQLGFLLGSRKYDPEVALFKNGDRLIVTVNRIVEEDSGLSVFDCSISINQQVVANAKVNTFQPHDVDAYLRSEYE